MRRTAHLLVFLSLVVGLALIAQGTDIGVKLGIQTPSLTLQGEWDVSPEMTMGFFLETTLESLLNLFTTQTRSMTIGMMAKYRFTHIFPPLVPYLGIAAGFEVQGSASVMNLDLLIGARWYPSPSFYVFADAAFGVWPYDTLPWYAVLGRYKNAYRIFWGGSTMSQRETKAKLHHVPAPLHPGLPLDPESAGR